MEAGKRIGQCVVIIAYLIAMVAGAAGAGIVLAIIIDEWVSG